MLSPLFPDPTGFSLARCHPSLAGKLYLLCRTKNHSFEQTALTQMSRAGIPLQVIQEILGHRSLQALQWYLEVSELQLEGAIAALRF